MTDAQLVLGRLRPGPLAGGAVTLDGALAREAIETKLAKPLGLSVEEAAAGVIRLLEQNLLHAVERLSIERGHNPATFTLVAAGGAGPMHGATVARALGCQRALLPRASGAFCAMGMLQSDVRQDYLKVFLADLDKVEPRRARSGSSRASSEALAARLDADALQSSASSTCATRASNGRCGSALDGLDTDGRARQASRPSTSAFTATSSRSGRIDITALRVIGRTPLDWTPPAARSPQAVAADAARDAQGLDRCRARLARRAGL